MAINNGVQSHPWSTDAVEFELRARPRLSSVAMSGTSIAGYCLARQIGDAMDLMMIGVSVPYQRRGVGKLLIQHLFDQVAPGMEIFLEVSQFNVGAIHLYEKMGFKTYLVRKAYYRDGADALCMKLEVANPQ